jgi:3-hydroxyisobutyrate dehydrogenase-like beta-hydroxyacid dehydrogenase
MKIGFIGLGQMGRPMALNMLKSGAEVLVNAAVPTAYAELERAGARPVPRAMDAADSDVVFLCLPSGDSVRDVLFGAQGLAPALGAGQVVVDTSTITYATTTEIARRLKECGVDFLDAPVSGMEARAIEGTLTVMCGGDQAVFDQVEPLLRCIGNQILYMGRSGSGQLAKLINQLLFDVNCAALAEILPMAAKMSLDPDQVAAVINSGTGRSYASEFFVPRILKGGFTSGYPMKSAYKDLVSAAEIGAQLCIPMPVLAAATASYQTALLQGHGDRDKGAMLLPFESLLGVRFRSPELKGADRV